MLRSLREDKLCGYEFQRKRMNLTNCLSSWKDLNPNLSNQFPILCWDPYGRTNCVEIKWVYKQGNDAEIKWYFWNMKLNRQFECFSEGKMYREPVVISLTIFSIQILSEFYSNWRICIGDILTVYIKITTTFVIGFAESLISERI